MSQDIKEQRIARLRRAISKARAVHSELIAERRVGIITRTMRLDSGVLGLRTDWAVRLVCKQLRDDVRYYAIEIRRLN